MMMLTVTVAARPGGFVRIGGFLVHREGDVPTPKHEDGEGNTSGDQREAADLQWIEPTELELGEIESTTRESLTDRHDVEDHDRRDLKKNQCVLQVLRGIQTTVGNPTSNRDEHNGRGDINPQIPGPISDRVIARELRDQQVEEVHRDCREVGHHQDRGCD